LLIEDSKTDAVLIAQALTIAAKSSYQVKMVENISAALRALGEEKFDVILLDLSLSDTTGFNGLLSIQNMAPKLPLVILTAYADEEAALKAVEHGAQDYLFKDKVSGYTIQRAMQYAIKRKQFEETLITRANFDYLTGLVNRNLLENRLEMALARSKRSGDGIGVFFLDLDRFKQVNDSFGHPAGDLLLKEVAERLKQSFRTYDTAARFGGDEFALLIEDIKQASDCTIIAEKIIQKISEPFIINNKQANVGVSIGIATCLPGENFTREDLMQKADQAMYRAKLVKDSAYRFYTQE